MIDAMGKALQEKMAGYQEEMLFHFKELEIREVKKYLRDQGISVRL